MAFPTRSSSLFPESQARLRPLTVRRDTSTIQQDTWIIKQEAAVSAMLAS